MGDTVVVTTKTSEKKTFAVTAVEADALVGKDVRVAYADMAGLDVKRIRKGATTGLVVAIVFVVGSIIAAVEATESFKDVFDGPY